VFRQKTDIAIRPGLWHDRSMSKNERRRRNRIAMTQKIKHSKYQVLGTPVFEENSAVDISSGGVSFVTGQEYQVGTLVLLELDLSEEPLKILVCVAWIKKAPEDARKFLVGAELIAIDPEHKRAMQNHLAKLIRQSSSESKISSSSKKKTQDKPKDKKKSRIRRKSKMHSKKNTNQTKKKTKSVASKTRKSASPRRGKA
jgi:Tfp pilus assembly protein PilZ